MSLIKLDIQEFIFEVKDEIMCYEELGEKYADLWEKNFNVWLNNKNNKNNKKYKNIKVDNVKNKTYYLLQDESDIFAIVDEYYSAVEQNSCEDYWKNFE